MRSTSRDQFQVLLEQSSLHREGLFYLHFILALVVSIGVVLVTSGVGLTERTHEIGLLKATGWGTDEVLLRSLAESMCLSAISWALAIILALVWLRWLNGWGVASLFISGLTPASQVRIPYALTAFSAGLGGLIAASVVLTGSLYSAWRAAVAAPLAAMRQ